MFSAALFPVSVGADFFDSLELVDGDSRYGSTNAGNASNSLCKLSVFHQ